MARSPAVSSTRRPSIARPRSSVGCFAARRAITGARDYLKCMKPGSSVRRLMRMTNELRAAAGVVLALTAAVLAGCGTTAPPATPSAAAGIARGVAKREPLADPRPYGTADTALGLSVLDAWCQADPRANLVLSPSSLASGLGMAYLGARGATAQLGRAHGWTPVTNTS